MTGRDFHLITRVGVALKTNKIFSLRQLAKVIGVHRDKLRLAVKRDPILARLTEHIKGWNGPRGGRTLKIVLR